MRKRTRCPIVRAAAGRRQPSRSGRGVDSPCVPPFRPHRLEAQVANAIDNVTRAGAIAEPPRQIPNITSTTEDLQSHKTSSFFCEFHLERQCRKAREPSDT